MIHVIPTVNITITIVVTVTLQHARWPSMIHVRSTVIVSCNRSLTTLTTENASRPLQVPSIVLNGITMTSKNTSIMRKPSSRCVIIIWLVGTARKELTSAGVYSLISVIITRFTMTRKRTSRPHILRSPPLLPLLTAIDRKCRADIATVLPRNVSTVMTFVIRPHSLQLVPFNDDSITGMAYSETITYM